MRDDSIVDDFSITPEKPPLPKVFVNQSEEGVLNITSQKDRFILQQEQGRSMLNLEQTIKELPTEQNVQMLTLNTCGGEVSRSYDQKLILRTLSNQDEVQNLTPLNRLSKASCFSDIMRSFQNPYLQSDLSNSDNTLPAQTVEQSSSNFHRDFFIQKKRKDNLRLQVPFESKLSISAKVINAFQQARKEELSNLSIEDDKPKRKNSQSKNAQNFRKGGLLKSLAHLVTNSLNDSRNQIIQSTSNVSALNLLEEGGGGGGTPVSKQIISNRNIFKKNGSTQLLAGSPNSKQVPGQSLMKGGFMATSTRSPWTEALTIIYVHKFKSLLKGLVSHLFPPNLTFQQLELLGDKATYQEIKENKNLKNFLTEISEIKLPQKLNWLAELDVINPNSTSLLIWKSFVMIQSLVSVFIFSLQASFQIGIISIINDSDDMLALIIYIIYFAVILLDCVIGLNTGFYTEGKIEKNRLKIAKQSMKGPFWVHVIKAILFVILITSEELNYIVPFFLCLLCLYGMTIDFTFIDEYCQLQQKWPFARLMGILLVMIFTVAHLSGCCFYSISQIDLNFSFSMQKNKSTNSGVNSNSNCNNWVTCLALDDDTWQVRYIFSLYFSFITMITVGYGDIYPVSILEKIYVIIMTCFTCAIFAYTINSIGALINELQQKQLAFKQEQNEVLMYMNKRQISKQTQMKVVKFIEHVQEKERENPANGQKILKKVSSNLKHAVKAEYFGQILKESKLFESTFSSGFLDEVIEYMNEVLLSPDEIIDHSPNTLQFQNNFIYYVVEGEIGVYSSRSTQNLIFLQKIKKQEFFGLTSFFTEQIDESIQLKTLQTSLIVSLSHADFMKCLSNFPIDFEKYHHLKQQLNNSQRQLQACPICGELSHEQKRCKVLHLNLNTSIVQRRYQFSHLQTRDRIFTRKIDAKTNTLSISIDVRRKMRHLRSNMILKARNLQTVPLASVLFDNLDEETDVQFLRRVASVRYSQECIVTHSDNCITESEMDSISEYGNSKDQAIDEAQSNGFIEESDDEDEESSMDSDSLQSEQKSQSQNSNEENKVAKQQSQKRIQLRINKNIKQQIQKFKDLDSDDWKASDDEAFSPSKTPIHKQSSYHSQKCNQNSQAKQKLSKYKNRHKILKLLQSEYQIEDSKQISEDKNEKEEQNNLSMIKSSEGSSSSDTSSLSSGSSLKLKPKLIEQNPKNKSSINQSYVPKKPSIEGRQKEQYVYPTKKVVISSNNQIKSLTKSRKTIRLSSEKIFSYNEKQNAGGPLMEGSNSQFRNPSNNQIQNLPSSHKIVPSAERSTIRNSNKFKQKTVLLQRKSSISTNEQIQPINNLSQKSSNLNRRKSCMQKPFENGLQQKSIRFMEEQTLNGHQKSSQKLMSERVLKIDQSPIKKELLKQNTFFDSEQIFQGRKFKINQQQIQKDTFPEERDMLNSNNKKSLKSDNEQQNIVFNENNQKRAQDPILKYQNSMNSQGLGYPTTEVFESKNEIPCNISQQQQQNDRENLFLYEFEEGREWVVFQPQHNLSVIMKEIKKTQRIAAIKQKFYKPKLLQIFKKSNSRKKF